MKLFIILLSAALCSALLLHTAGAKLLSGNKRRDKNKDKDVGNLEKDIRLLCKVYSRALCGKKRQRDDHTLPYGVTPTPNPFGRRGHRFNLPPGVTLPPGLFGRRGRRFNFPTGVTPTPNPFGRRGHRFNLPPGVTLPPGLFGRRGRRFNLPTGVTPTPNPFGRPGLFYGRRHGPTPSFELTVPCIRRICCSLSGRRQPMFTAMPMEPLPTDGPAGSDRGRGRGKKKGNRRGNGGSSDVVAFGGTLEDIFGAVVGGGQQRGNGRKRGNGAGNVDGGGNGGGSGRQKKQNGRRG